MPIFFCFFISILAKINQRPIDLVERESKLVSGFNVEYFEVEFLLQNMHILLQNMHIFLFYIILFIFRNSRIFIVRLHIIVRLHYNDFGDLYAESIVSCLI
jgi:NADH:ubiquinone oxidoreductase subunit H